MMKVYLANKARGDCHVDAARMGAPKREREEQAKVAAVAAMVANRVKGSGDAFDKVMQKRDEKQNDALSRLVITEVGLVPDPRHLQAVRGGDGHVARPEVRELG